MTKDEVLRKEREEQRSRMMKSSDKVQERKTFPKSKAIIKKANQMLVSVDDMFKEAGMNTDSIVNSKDEIISDGEIIAELIKTDCDVIQTIKNLDIKSATQFFIKFENTEALLKLEDYYRNGLVRKAEHEMVQLLKSDNEKIRMDTAQFILKTLGARKGWYSGPEIAIDMRGNTQEELRKEIQNIFGIDDNVETISYCEHQPVKLPEDPIEIKINNI